MPLWLEVVISLFLLGGSLFALIGAIGLYRLPDFYTRLHGPTKATTLGVGGISWHRAFSSVCSGAVSACTRY